jgi:hypothetical protein
MSAMVVNLIVIGVFIENRETTYIIAPVIQ